MNFKEACREVAKKLNEDLDTVHKVAMYQFEFIRNIMNDPEDTHDILLHDLFRFKLKSRFKENKQRNYSPKL